MTHVLTKYKRMATSGPYIDPTLSLGEIKGELSTHFNEADQHPDYPLSEWRHAVSRDETREGYWSWVAESIQQGD